MLLHDVNFLLSLIKIKSTNLNITCDKDLKQNQSLT